MPIMLADKKIALSQNSAISRRFNPTQAQDKLPTIKSVYPRIKNPLATRNAPNTLEIVPIHAIIIHAPFCDIC